MRTTRDVNRTAFVVLAILPAFALSFGFHIFPVFQGLYTSFFSWSGLSQRRSFVGLQNFERLFSDPIVLTAIGNDIYLLVVKVIITMGMALGIGGMLLLRFRRLEKPVQAVFFFPNLLSVAIVAIIFRFVFNPSIGILNGLLSAVGLESLAQPWLGRPGTALNAILFSALWASIGYQLLIVTAGTKQIPRTLLEAAYMDGAGNFTVFFRVVLPLMRGVIRTSLILMVINTLNETFVFIRIMTGGGPSHSTEVLGTYMYFQAFDNFRFGYGTAVASINFVLALVLALILTKVVRPAEQIDA